MFARTLGHKLAEEQIAGYFPIALRKFVYVYAAFRLGKNSSNLASGRAASTFFTFSGLVASPGPIFSTKLFGKVQDVLSLKD